MASNANRSMAWAGKIFADRALDGTTIVQRFTPGTPLATGGSRPGDGIVLADKPHKIKAAAQTFVGLSVECLQANAIEVLDWFEHVVLEHVLKKQVSDKTLRKLMQRSTELESHNPTMAKLRYAGGNLASSCLIGQDPFGDKPMAESDSDPKNREVQLLLQSIQEQALTYARVHLPSLLDEELSASVRELEHRYRMKASLRRDAPRGETPWAAYRKTVLKHLPKQTGGYQRTWMCTDDAAGAQRGGHDLGEADDGSALCAKNLGS